MQASNRLTHHLEVLRYGGAKVNAELAGFSPTTPIQGCLCLT